MPLYFAYGANMSRSGMARRCPGARPVGPAELPGYRFRITTDGVANIVREDAASVHGILWRLTAQHVHALDDYEGVAWGWYRHRLVRVRTAGPREATALAYVGRNRHRGRPLRDYHDNVVLAAAREWALPAAYLAELESWRRDFGPLGRAWRTAP